MPKELGSLPPISGQERLRFALDRIDVLARAAFRILGPVEGATRLAGLGPHLVLADGTGSGRAERPEGARCCRQVWLALRDFHFGSVIAAIAACIAAWPVIFGR
jgi:hypothetical protein